MIRGTVARNPIIDDDEKVPHIMGTLGRERRLSLIGWAVAHQPTREAYRLCTGEDIAPALDRFRSWLEENIIGASEDTAC